MTREQVLQVITRSLGSSRHAEAFDKANYILDNLEKAGAIQIEESNSEDVSVWDDETRSGAV